MKKIAAAALGVILAISLSGIAQAGTKGGTTTCTNGAVNAVRGLQQRPTSMTLKTAGYVVYQGNLYDAVGKAPNGGTKTWSAHSDWLLWNGTYGFCAPQYR